MKVKTHYKNRLPHIAPIGRSFFVTFRFQDSLPRKIVTDLKLELDQSIRKLRAQQTQNSDLAILKLKKQFFKKYDHQLDREPYGVCHFKNPEIAEIMKSKLHQYDKILYDLIAYCIMPNHVHMLIDTSVQITDENDLLENEAPKNYKQLYDIMKLIKGGSFYLINKALNRKGTLWQKDSYDHFVRDDRAFSNIVNYILQNPVKAGLVERWEDYPHTYLVNV